MDIGCKYPKVGTWNLRPANFSFFGFKKYNFFHSSAWARTRMLVLGCPTRLQYTASDRKCSPCRQAENVGPAGPTYYWCEMLSEKDIFFSVFGHVSRFQSDWTRQYEPRLQVAKSRYLNLRPRKLFPFRTNPKEIKLDKKFECSSASYGFAVHCIWPHTNTVLTWSRAGPVRLQSEAANEELFQTIFCVFVI